MAVPKAMQATYDEIAVPIEAFCAEHLNDDYLALCLKLLEKLCRKRPSPLLGGRKQTWAAGVVYAIGANNFLFDKSNPHYISSPDAAKAFGLAASTVGNKAAEIRKMFDITFRNAQWLTPEHIRANPLVWMIEVNGFLVDARHLPVELQELAHKKGLIPFVPDTRDTEDD